MTEFIAYPKTPRLFREIVITEKIDGTNAGIQILPIGRGPDPQDHLDASMLVFMPGDQSYAVYAQSRKRLITPDDDNFGFAAWVANHATDLVKTLGEGVHFGEWWGSGIQRGYGLAKGEKRFSLFNVGRWADADLGAVPGLGVVPTLYQGVFSEDCVSRSLADLDIEGSQAAPGFLDPEGVIVFHTQSRQTYKVLLENDELPKGLVS